MQRYGYSEDHVFSAIFIKLYSDHLISAGFQLSFQCEQEFFHFCNKVCVYCCYRHIVSKNQFFGFSKRNYYSDRHLQYKFKQIYQKLSSKIDFLTATLDESGTDGLERPLTLSVQA